MKKTSFEEQFPGYPIVPEKNRAWMWALAWAGALLLAGALPLLTLKLLSYTVPTPNMAGAGKLTQATIRRIAMTHSARDEHAAAAASFQKYFAVGGQDADMMAMYAYTLAELGRMDEAKTWSRKATDKDPQSKAAQMIHKALNK